jgi:heme oxygenase
MTVTQIRRAPRLPACEAVTTRLDQALAPLVTELHGLPVFQNILNGTIDRATYSSLLQSLLTMHRSLERALSAAAHLKGFDAPAFRREDALIRDLRILGGHLPVRANEVLDQFESQVRAWTRPPCASLVGAIYAIERQRKDSLRLARPLATALRLKVATRSGLDYFLDGADRAARRFRELQGWIDANVRHPDREKDLVEGVLRTMQTLVALHQHVNTSA